MHCLELLWHYQSGRCLKTPLEVGEAHLGGLASPSQPPHPPTHIKKGFPQDKEMKIISRARKWKAGCRYTGLVCGHVCSVWVHRRGQPSVAPGRVPAPRATFMASLPGPDVLAPPKMDHGEQIHVPHGIPPSKHQKISINTPRYIVAQLAQCHSCTSQLGILFVHRIATQLFTGCTANVEGFRSGATIALLRIKPGQKPSVVPGCSLCDALPPSHNGCGLGSPRLRVHSRHPKSR